MASHYPANPAKPDDWTMDHSIEVFNACSRLAAWWRAELTGSPATTLLQLEGFENDLKDELYRMACARYSVKVTQICLGCDYGPDKMLANVAASSCISIANFPIKTLSWLDYRPGEVVARVAKGTTAERIELKPVG